MADLKILFVSREAETLSGLLSELRRKEYGVDDARSAADALAMLAGAGHDLVVVTDDVPDAGPVEFVGQARGVAPEVPVVVLAEHPTVVGAVEAMRHGASYYAGVSDSPEELLEAVRAALGPKLEVIEEEERLKERRLLSVEDLKSIEIIDAIMAAYDHNPAKLVGILQDIQKELRYLPQDALRHVAERLGVPLPRVYSVATFYQAFSLTPRGRHIIKVCMGTACHVRGAPRVLEEIERKLGIKAGETTYDLEYTLLTVNCLGCCALGPVVVVDDTYHSVRPWQAGSVLAGREKGTAPGAADAASAADRKSTG
jgi:NADH-quinone oxidoreductase subunit E